MKFSYVFIAVLVLFVLCYGDIARAGISIPRAFHTSITPHSAFEKDVPISFSIEYSLEKTLYHLAEKTGSLKISLFPLREQGNILYCDSIEIVYDDTYSFKHDFQIIIPDNNIFVLKCDIECGRAKESVCRFFNAIGETVKYSEVLIDPPMPRGYVAPDRGLYSPKLDRDTLTHDQLEKVYNIRIDLRDEQHFQFARRLLGGIPDSCSVKGYKGLYRMRVTLDQILKLGDYGIGLDMIHKDSPE